MTMHYFDGQDVVELFDHVEVNIDGMIFHGQITKLHPRLETVRVRYQDYLNTNRNGDEPTRSATVNLSQVDFAGRDG